MKSEELSKSLDNILEKAKYKKRWKGKDGRWRYEYDRPKGKKGGGGDDGDGKKEGKDKDPIKNTTLMIDYLNARENGNIQQAKKIQAQLKENLGSDFESFAKKNGNPEDSDSSMRKEAYAKVRDKWIGDLNKLMGATKDVKKSATVSGFAESLAMAKASLEKSGKQVPFIQSRMIDKTGKERKVYRLDREAIKQAEDKLAKTKEYLKKTGVADLFKKKK